jgi:hypothetical protein
VTEWAKRGIGGGRIVSDLHCGHQWPSFSPAAACC